MTTQPMPYQKPLTARAQDIMASSGVSLGIPAAIAFASAVNTTMTRLQSPDVARVSDAVTAFAAGFGQSAGGALVCAALMGWTTIIARHNDSPIEELAENSIVPAMIAGGIAGSSFALPTLARLTSDAGQALQNIWNAPLPF